MINTCATHREFLGALADGEKDLVPAATIEHVENCADCTREAAAHRLLNSRLREAGAHLDEAVQRPLPANPRRRRLAVIAIGAAAALVIAVAAAGWTAFVGPDPVSAAVSASSQPLQIQSADPSQVGAWCLQASGKSLPSIQLDGMAMVGARMDRVPSTDIVTVSYTAPGGARVTVSWLEGKAPGGSGVEAKVVSGHHALLVHAPRGTAVVVSSTNAAMWEAAAAVESI
ncbi:MAG: hypothetical protein NVS9B11_19440 [Candidatus Dormibacteraceae bacterium]